MTACLPEACRKSGQKRDYGIFACGKRFEPFQAQAILHKVERDGCSRVNALAGPKGTYCSDTLLNLCLDAAVNTPTRRHRAGWRSRDTLRVGSPGLAGSLCPSKATSFAARPMCAVVLARSAWRSPFGTKAPGQCDRLSQSPAGYNFSQTAPNRKVKGAKESPCRAQGDRFFGLLNDSCN